MAHYVSQLDTLLFFFSIFDEWRKGWMASHLTNTVETWRVLLRLPLKRLPFGFPPCLLPNSPDRKCSISDHNTFGSCKEQKIQLKLTLIKVIYELTWRQVQNEGDPAPQWHYHGLSFFLSFCSAFCGVCFFQRLTYSMVAKWLQCLMLHMLEGKRELLNIWEDKRELLFQHSKQESKDSLWLESEGAADSWINLHLRPGEWNLWCKPTSGSLLKWGRNLLPLATWDTQGDRVPNENLYIVRKGRT